MADSHQAAREVVSRYYEDQLSALVVRAGQAVDRFRSGELDVYGAEQDLVQYSRSAKELWTFCHVGRVEEIAEVIAAGHPSDWWVRGEFRRR